MNGEQWRPVKGFEGIYEVSDLGRVRSLDRVTLYRERFTRVYKGRVLSPKKSSDGYLWVGLYKDGECTYRYIHALVAEAFLGRRETGMEVNHLNGRKGNNRPSNLEYCTPSENMKHAYRTGLKKTTPVYCDNGMAYQSMSAAARATGVNSGSICRCCQGKQQTAGGYRWSYRPILEELA